MKTLKNTISLKKEYDFRKVLKYGKYYNEDFLTLYILENSKENVNKLGICVSKKHGNSVVRNRLKRWAREAYKDLEDEQVIGKNIVIIYKKDIKERIKSHEICFGSVKDNLQILMKKAGIICEK